MIVYSSLSTPSKVNIIIVSICVKHPTSCQQKCIIKSIQWSEIYDYINNKTVDYKWKEKRLFVLSIKKKLDDKKIKSSSTTSAFDGIAWDFYFTFILKKEKKYFVAELRIHILWWLIKTQREKN